MEGEKTVVVPPLVVHVETNSLCADSLQQGDLHFGKIYTILGVVFFGHLVS